MIDRVIGNRLLPANIRKDIIERTDGIPLFVEEMTKTVLEARGELEAMQTAAAVSLPGAGGSREWRSSGKPSVIVRSLVRVAG